MTRIKATHSYHEAKSLNPEAFCKKCSEATAHVCEWCGACKACHTGSRSERSY